MAERGRKTCCCARLPHERLEAEFQYVRDLHLNTIRMEAQIGPDAIFDQADEKGILIMAGWCCCDIWEKWDKWPAGTLHVATESLRSEALRLRKHPSLMTWLTGSDGPPPPDVENAYLQALREAAWPNPVVSSAADISSPVSGPSGVKMSGPYDYEPPSYWLLSRPPDSGNRSTMLAMVAVLATTPKHARALRSLRWKA